MLPTSRMPNPNRLRTPESAMWTVTEETLPYIAIGAGILGTGGGGNPYIGQLRAREAMRKWGPVTVLSPEELPDDARVVCVGGIGAPTVGVEKVRDLQSYYALRAIEDYVGESATALISNEIGGSNSVEPLIAAAKAGLPVVDADGMGRAFPEFQMKTFFRLWRAVLPHGRCRRKGQLNHRARDHHAGLGGKAGPGGHHSDGLRRLLRRGSDDPGAGQAHRRSQHPVPGP